MSEAQQKRARNDELNVAADHEKQRKAALAILERLGFSETDVDRWAREGRPKFLEQRLSEVVRQYGSCFCGLYNRIENRGFSSMPRLPERMFENMVEETKRFPCEPRYWQPDDMCETLAEAIHDVQMAVEKLQQAHTRPTSRESYLLESIETIEDVSLDTKLPQIHRTKIEAAMKNIQLLKTRLANNNQ